MTPKKKVVARKKVATKKATSTRKKVAPLKKAIPVKKPVAAKKKVAEALPVQPPSAPPPKRIKIIIPPGRSLTAEGWIRRD